MARVKIEEIIEYLDDEMKRALADTVKAAFPDAEINTRQLFQEFKRNVQRRCNTWENVPDRLVEG
jgi:hypothetical protein